MSSKEEANIYRKWLVNLAKEIGRLNLVRDEFYEELENIYFHDTIGSENQLGYLKYLAENNIEVSNTCNSSIAYAIGITNHKPTQTMGTMGGTFPDIDCDFQDDRRLEVAQYISNKYGEECVAQIPTFATFKPKGAIRDFTRVQDKPWDLGDQMTKLVPPPLYGKEPKWDQVLDEAPELLSNPDYQPITLMAKRASGLIRHSGIHAAGLVIAPSDFTNYGPIRTGPNGEHVAQWDMDTLERMGLIKMDLLGISTLRLISKCIDLIKEHKGQDININKIPLDDPEVFKLIQQGDVAGLFQLDQGGGIRDLAVQSRPVSIEDISSILALYRPGPLECGATNEYVARAQGSPVEYLVPELKPILESTYGVLVYQEQIIKIATDLAGLSLSDADILRKAVGKKKKELMAQQEDKLIHGMMTNGTDKSAAEQIWSWIVGFAAYSFNKTVDKDTLVCTIEGEKRIEDCQAGDIVFTMTPEGKIERSKVVALHDHGIVPLWEVEFDDGTSEKCTLDHKWLTEQGQTPLWKIMQMGLSVWGTLQDTSETIRTPEDLQKMPRAFEASQGNLFNLPWMSTTFSVKKTTPKAQIYMREIPRDSAKWHTFHQTTQDVVWIREKNDKKGIKTTQRKLPRMSTYQKRNKSQNLQQHRPYSGTSQNIFRNGQKNINETRNPNAKSTTTCGLETPQPRTICRNYQKSTTSSKAIKNGKLFRNSFRSDGIQKKCPATMWRQEKASRFCQQKPKNCHRDRWPMAFFGHQRTRISRQNSTERSNARLGNREKRMEVNPALDGELSWKKRRTKNIQAQESRTYYKTEMGRSVIYRKPISITFCGYKQGYDLEVDHPSHNYILASGLCCSNSHSMSYAFITYYTAYLKTYYPLEFHCALLDNHRDERDKLVEYLANCRAKDIQVLGPDINESDVGFAISDGCIRFGLAGIKGIGKVAENIVQERKEHGPYTDIKSFYKRTRGLRVTKSVIEALAKSSALISLGAPRSAVMSVVALLSDYDKDKEKYEKKLNTYKKRMIKYEEREEERRIAKENKTKVPGKLKFPKEPEKPTKPVIPKMEELSVHEIMALEREMLGVYISSHPLYDYEQEILKFTDTHTNSIQDHQPHDPVSIIGLISSIKRITTKKGDRMAILTLEDLHGFTEVVVFPKTYSQVSKLIKENNIILIQGRVESNTPGSTKLIAQKIGELEKKYSPKVDNRRATIVIDVRNVGKSLDKIQRIVQADSGTVLTDVIASSPNGKIKLNNSKALSDEQLVKLTKVPGVSVKL